jgi:hypothetical protein
MRGTKCPKCSADLRMKVCLYVDAPVYFCGFDKMTLRSRHVKVDGVNWPDMILYCPKCAWQGGEDETRLLG